MTAPSLTWDAGQGLLTGPSFALAQAMRKFPQHQALVLSEMWHARGRFVTDEEIAKATMLLAKPDVHAAVRHLRKSLPDFGLFIVSLPQNSRSYRLVHDSFCGALSMESPPTDSKSAATPAPPHSSDDKSAQAAGPDFKMKGSVNAA